MVQSVRLSVCPSVRLSVSHLFAPQSLKASGYCRRSSGWAAGQATGQTSPVNTLTSIIFHGSFSNLARTFITLTSRMSSIMELLPY